MFFLITNQNRKYWLAIIMVLTTFLLSINPSKAEQQVQTNNITPSMADVLLTHASEEELEHIEKQLIRLNELSEYEKKQLRKLIIDIQIREEKDIAENQARLEKVRSDIAKERWFRDTFREKPEDIVKSRKLTDQVDQAQNAPIHQIKQITKTIMVDLNAPEPIEVPVAIGWGAVIIFLDRFGTPFPILNPQDFTGSNFTLSAEKILETNNVISVISEVPYAQANASIFFKGQNLPLMLKFTSSDKENATRLIIRMKQTSPLTQPEYYVAPSAAGVDNSLYQVADYNIPEGAKELVVTHDAGAAWKIDDHIILRTPYKLISPFTSESLVSSIGGSENVYRFQNFSQVLLLINNKQVQVSIMDKRTAEIAKIKEFE